MGRPKGGKNRSWSKEEKLRIVRRYFDDKIGQWTIAKEENITLPEVTALVEKEIEQDG